MAAQKKKPEAVIEDGAVYVLRAGTPIFVKTADICAMTGKSNQWIGQLVSQGTLNKKSTPHGSLFDLLATMRAYTAMLEERLNSAEEKKAESAAEKEKQEAEISIKKAKAIITVLEAKELQGKMHRSEDVAAMTEDLIYNIRSMLLALPGRLAVDVASTQDPAEAAEIIRREVYKIMEELSNYKYDPKKYEERVRERRSWDIESGDIHDDEE
jgi:phage terminase Nu1 subunit (DNA packaging protein)